MKHAIDAIYENGAFRPLQPAAAIAEGQHVRLLIVEEQDSDAVQLAASVYAGLSDKEIEDVEQIALSRGIFFGQKAAD